MPYRSLAQQRYLHAAEKRGEVPTRVVEKFDRETPRGLYPLLPMHVKHQSRIKKE